MECANFTFLVGLLTFLLGAFIGHRLNIALDKRREWNEAIKPLRMYFIAETEHPRSSVPVPDQESVRAVVARATPWQRRRLRRAIERHRQTKHAAQTCDPSYGTTTYANPTEIAEAAEKVLRLLNEQ